MKMVQDPFALNPRHKRAKGVIIALPLMVCSIYLYEEPEE